MKTTFIYALKDPAGSIRYIGKSDNPKSRLSAHLQYLDAPSYKNNWIKKLLAQGQVPQLILLKEVPASDWEEWEQRYIRCARSLGFVLTNATEGGGGPSGRTFSEEQLQQMRVRVSGEKNPMYGKARSEESRQKVAASCRSAKLRKDNTSGFVGVSWHKPTRKWISKIGHPHPPYKNFFYLGVFSKIEDAVFVRALAMDKYFPKE